MSTAMKDQKITALPPTKPPRASWSPKGKARIRNCWTFRNSSKRRRRRKIRRSTNVRTAYANGIAAAVRSP
jgi:hypothetical protein